MQLSDLATAGFGGKERRHPPPTFFANVVIPGELRARVGKRCHSTVLSSSSRANRRKPPQRFHDAKCDQHRMKSHCEAAVANATLI